MIPAAGIIAAKEEGNMTNLLNQINNWVVSPAVDNPVVRYVGIVLMTLLGIIYCLYGLKLVRVISTMIGAGIGCLVGYEVATLTNLQFPVNAAVIAVCAIIFGLLGFFLRRLGIFLAVFCGVFSVVLSLLTEYTTFDKVIVAIISLVSGLVFSILSIVYGRPLVIISTALIGGMMFSNEVCEHLVQIRWDPQIEMYVRLGAGAVLALIGIIFQFLKSRGKKTAKE